MCNRNGLLHDLKSTTLYIVCGQTEGGQLSDKREYIEILFTVCHVCAGARFVAEYVSTQGIFLLFFFLKIIVFKRVGETVNDRCVSTIFCIWHYDIAYWQNHCTVDTSLLAFCFCIIVSYLQSFEFALCRWITIAYNKCKYCFIYVQGAITGKFWLILNYLIISVVRNPFLMIHLNQYTEF